MYKPWPRGAYILCRYKPIHAVHSIATCTTLIVFILHCKYMYTHMLVLFIQPSVTDDLQKGFGLTALGGCGEEEEEGGEGEEEGWGDGTD